MSKVKSVGGHLNSAQLAPTQLTHSLTCCFYFFPFCFSAFRLVRLSRRRRQRRECKQNLPASRLPVRGEAKSDEIGSILRAHRQLLNHQDRKTRHKREASASDGPLVCINWPLMRRRRRRRRRRRPELSCQIMLTSEQKV